MGIAYNAFLAIPSALLVAVGAFTVFATPSTIQDMLNNLADFVPQDVIKLLSDSLTQISRTQSGVTLLVVGVLLGVWSLTGSMQTLMWGLNTTYGRKETRSYIRRRLLALAMVGCTLVAFGIVFTLFVLGPRLSDWVGRHGGQSWADNGWSIVQWPVVIVALLLMFAMLMRLGPNVETPRFAIFSYGGVFSVVAWLVLSDLFAYFTNRFGSYNKTWGSLAAVIVVLVWLRLSALVLLLGAEINAERGYYGPADD